MSVWEEIKNKLSVDEVIADYIPVRQNGANLKCLCPFHNERTPSMIISPEKQIWHCFGCGAGGDIFAFVSQYENIERSEALQKLAKKAGVTLEPFKKLKPKTLEEKTEEKKIKDKHQQGFEALDWVTNVYHQILLNVLKDPKNPITQYCLQRGLSHEIIQTFCIGYAPKGNFLLKLAKKYKISTELLFNIGVLKRSTKNQQNDQNEQINQQKSEFSDKFLENQYLDKFADRLMIPISNKDGKYVGYTGRVLPYDKSDRPKYLNSPQSEWFNKSEIWFGWPLAFRKANLEKKVIIVEGNMDVIAAFSYGFNYTMASQGTSFSEIQINQLKRLRSEILLAFDNDAAGQIAGHKFYLQATAFGLNVKKVLIPEEFKDLDEYLQSFKSAKLNQKQKESVKETPETLQESAKSGESLELKSIPYPEFLIKKHANDLRSDNLEKQKEAIEQIAQSLAVIDNISMEQYVQKLHEITKIRSQTLFSLIQQMSQNTVISGFLLQAKKQKNIENFDQQNQQKDLQKSLNSDQQALVMWQKLSSLYIFLGQTEEVWSAKMMMMFMLLQKLLPIFKEYQHFSDYQEKESAMLQLVFQEDLPQKSQQTMKQLWMQLTYWLDNNITNILLDEDVKDVYLALKKAEMG